MADVVLNPTDLVLSIAHGDWVARIVHGSSQLELVADLFDRVFMPEDRNLLLSIPDRVFGRGETITVYVDFWGTLRPFMVTSYEDSPVTRNGLRPFRLRLADAPPTDDPTPSRDVTLSVEAAQGRLAPCVSSVWECDLCRERR